MNPAHLPRVLEGNVQGEKRAAGGILETSKKLIQIQMYPAGRDRGRARMPRRMMCSRYVGRQLAQWTRRDLKLQKTWRVMR